ncbi:hybrid sensor histidine kinase/response regulator [Leptospira idonii]|nr:PAS domain S-box protein [Leptospira idonii]
MNQEASGMMDFFRLLPQTYPGGVYLFEPKSGAFLFANDYFEKILGSPSKGKTFFQSDLLAKLHPEDRIHFETRSLTLSQSQEGSHFENDFRFLLDSKGLSSWLHFEEKLVRLPQISEEFLVIGFVRDVTNEKVNEQNIKEQIQFFLGLFENASVGMALQDWEGGYFRINRRFTEITGYTIHSLTDLNLKRIRGEALSPEELEYFKFFKEGMDETTLTGKDGRKIDVYRKTNTFRNAQGKPDFYYVFLDDLTEKKRKDSYHLHSQKLETIGSLAGNLAHDLNNYLQPIHVFSKLGQDLLVSSGTQEAYREKLKEFFIKIGTAADSARSMVHRIIRYSKTSEEEVIDRVDVSSALESSIPILVAESPKNVRLEFSLCEDPLFVRIDPIRFSKLIGEFVMGSIFPWDSQKEGSVHISTGVPDGNEKDRFLISLRFSGLALSHLDLEFLNQSIFEEDEPKWILLQLANRHIKNWGGELLWEMKENSILLVSIYLPASSEKREAPVYPKEKKIEGKDVWQDIAKKKIWIVEDDDPSRESIAMVLGLKNIEPELFATPKEALERLKSEKPDFVLSDYRMKELNGLSLLRKIKESVPYLSAVLYTGNAEGIDIEMLEAEGILVRTKPISASELHESILLSFGFL